MKKRIIAILFAFVFCFCAAAPAFASDSDGFADEYYRLNDLADILSDSEEEELLATLDEISVRQKMDVTIAIVDDLNGYGSATECADDIYDGLSYGYGKDRDGILLLVSMEERDWAISTCGYGITAFTDAGCDYIGEQMKDDLSNGNYFDAFNTYASLCDEFITQAREGSPYDVGNLPREPLSFIWIPISIGIGVTLALIIVGVMKSKLKTVRFQTAANSYMKKDSLALTESSDLFLYHTVTRTAKPESSSSSGGSSTHRSSSGTTHGGSSGKF